MLASIGIALPTRVKRAADLLRAALRATLDLALPTLCPAGRGPRPVSGVLVETVLHQPPLLRAARHSLCV